MGTRRRRREKEGICPDRAGAFSVVSMDDGEK